VIGSGRVSGTQQNLDESCRLVPIAAGDMQSDLPILRARQVGQPFQALEIQPTRSRPPVKNQTVPEIGLPK
jgi:hypothetical protein